MTVAEYNEWHDHQSWLSQVFLDQNQKIHLPRIGYKVVDGCNLRCEHCNAFDPFRHGITPKEEVIESFHQWSTMLVPHTVHLVGGETFLHPHIADIAAAARLAFPRSDIVIITNGTLLQALKDSVLQSLRESEVQIAISKHMDTEEYNRKLDEGILRLQQFHLHYGVTNFNTWWLQFYDTNIQGIPVPSMSNPQKAWSRCEGKTCTNIVKNQLFRCACMLEMIRSVNEGAIGSEWNRVFSHKPMTLDNSPQEILAYLRGGAMSECSVCPEKIEQVEARQLSHEQVQQIKQHIQDRNRKAAYE